MEPKWYISFEPASCGKDRIYRRETKTFPTEAEAKAFARMILDSAFRVSAGTINPVQPKRVIGSKRGLSDWISER
ncbi:hypothetical protein ABIF65_007872 [Bradyrhizobium japonicum]|jgi:hypothetical protein|nr:hypothetical protein [Bradyrhizobium japonicum]MCP1863818.1 hypothetical protein [Bradyrhizobium japonicum]MCP1963445.1 hypothetical protein [Bradyrhizobium japonicum]MCW2327789.1 hypothetical protein [Bradyrhizobium japonicum]